MKKVTSNKRLIGILKELIKHTDISFEIYMSYLILLKKQENYLKDHNGCYYKLKKVCLV